jgi:hypothetical protein
LLIELTHQLMAKAADGSTMRMFAVSFDAASPAPWIVTAVLVAGGAFLARLVWPVVTRAWNDATAVARAGGPP